MKKTTLIVLGVVALGLVAVIGLQLASRSKENDAALRVAISPYQDLAMLMCHEHLELEAKHGVDIEIVTLAWENIIPSLASAGRTVDVGFGSLIEFLTKYENINPLDTSDPLVYIFPTYVFKGGGFVSFNPAVPNLDEEVPAPPDKLRQFFSFKLGAQKNSMFDMLLFSLSEQAGLDRSDIQIVDTTMADGILAAQAGSLDAVAAGLTQRNEALDRGGRVVLTMDKFGFADLTGLICKQSTLEERREEIEGLIRVWFDCVDYIYSDLDKNTQIPLDYLARASSTQYTVESYKRALENEYLPRSLAEAQRELIAEDGAFSIERISESVAKYLVDLEIASSAPPVPVPIDLRP